MAQAAQRGARQNVSSIARPKRQTQVLAAINARKVAKFEIHPPTLRSKLQDPIQNSMLEATPSAKMLVGSLRIFW
jgi:hypothetical protein